MSKKEHHIQRVELQSGDHDIHCPFCGAVAMAFRDGSEAVTDFCEHVLFMAHDAGFEYRSRRFDELMGIVGVDSEDIEFGDNGFDGYTDTVKLANSLKFASYQGAPSFFGAYVGFAPTDSD